MTDLWVEATHDFDREDSDRQLIAAREAVVDLWQFLSSASDQDDFENRKALIADRLDNAAQGETRQRLEAALDRDFEVVLSQRPKGRTAADQKLRVHEDVGGGVSARWVVQYYDSEKGMWFDKGDGMPTRAEAEEKLKGSQGEKEGSRKTADIYDYYDFDDEVCRATIKKLQAIDGYDEAAVLEAIRGIGYKNFEVLDEKPGYWGYNFGGEEWHWKLRNARNNAEGFFDAVGPRNASKTAYDYAISPTKGFWDTIDDSRPPCPVCASTVVDYHEPWCTIHETATAAKTAENTPNAYTDYSGCARCGHGYGDHWHVEGVSSCKFDDCPEFEQILTVADQDRMDLQGSKTAANVVGDACPARDVQAGAAHTPGTGKDATPPFKCIFCGNTIKAASTESSLKKTAEAWRVEVVENGDDRWIANQMTYPTQAEAKSASSRLMGNWMGVDICRVVPDSVPKNETLDLSDPFIVENWRKAGSRRTAEETPEKTSTCSKCGRSLEYFSDPEDDEARNWQDTTDGSSYCPADGGDHSPTTTASRRTAQKWRVEFIVADGSPQVWYTNMMRYDTEEEAAAAAQAKANAWMLVTDWRVVTEDTPEKQSLSDTGPGKWGSKSARRRVQGSGNGRRKQAWTEDMSDVSYMANKLMSLTDEALGSFSGDVSDPEMLEIENGLVTTIQPIVGDITDEDQAILEDYNYHITNRAIDRVKGRKKFSRKTAADVGDTECTNCGTFFDQAEVKARDDIPGTATTEFCTQNCYDEYYGPDLTALDVYEGRRKTAARCSWCDEGLPEGSEGHWHQGIKWPPKEGSRGSAHRHPFGRKTALAPVPTTTMTIDGREITVYASPSSTGQPRNRWIAIEILRSENVGHEWFGGADRDTVSRKAGRGPWRVIDTTQYEWTATPAWKMLGSKTAAAILDEDPENNTMTTEQGVWTMEYDSESMKRMKERDDYEPWFPEFPNEAEWSQPHHYKLTGPKGQVHEFSAQGDSVAGPWYSAWEQARSIVSRASRRQADVYNDPTPITDDPCPTCGGPTQSWSDNSEGITVNFACDNPGCPAGKGPWDTPRPTTASRKTAQAGPPEPWPESACGEQDEDTFCIRDTGHEGEHQFRSRFWVEQKMDEAGLNQIEEELPEEGEEQAEEVPENGDQPAEKKPEEKSDKPKGEVPPQFKKKTSRPKADLSKVAGEDYRRGFIDGQRGHPMESQEGEYADGYFDGRAAKLGMIKGAPFADYKDFADCVSKNQDADDPDAYCGYIKHKVEDSKESKVIVSALLPRLSSRDFEAATRELGRVSVEGSVSG